MPLTLLPALLNSEADALAAAIAGVGCIGFIVILLLLMAFPVFCFWRIFDKAGYSGALALLWLIPAIGPLVVICILAFGTWPNQRN